MQAIKNNYKNTLISIGFIILSCLLINCTTSEESIVLGCMDEEACNYDATATDDDYSCVYADSTLCEACLDEEVVSYDTDDDGVCDSDEVTGCTSSLACNYDSTATDDDDSCIVPNYADCEYCSGTEIATSTQCDYLYLTDQNTYSITVPEYNSSAIVAINFDTQEIDYNIAASTRQYSSYKSNSSKHTCGTPHKAEKTEFDALRLATQKSTDCVVPSEAFDTELFYESTYFKVYIGTDETDDTRSIVSDVIDRFEATAMLNFQTYWTRHFYDFDTYDKVDVYFIRNTGIWAMSLILVNIVIF